MSCPAPHHSLDTVHQIPSTYRSNKAQWISLVNTLLQSPRVYHHQRNFFPSLGLLETLVNRMSEAGMRRLERRRAGHEDGGHAFLVKVIS